MQKLSMDQLNRTDITAFKAQEKTPIVLVLDNVRSMHNVGSTFRTADGFALEKIILCGITACPPHREIEKTALGATQSVEWKHFQSNLEAIQSLKDEGYKIYAIEQVSNSISLPDFTVSEHEKYALIFGNEVHGVDEQLLPHVDGCIEVPQFGTKHSFNVSVTVGVVSWDLLTKMKYSYKKVD
ncbi:RNA methyltransferase [Sphingobacterium yanglingense]|nr:RNA methyltransferase [Sphingobacterium yanglingense]